MRDVRTPVGFGWNKAIQRIYCAPAQEEKEMEFECRCKKCDCGFMSDRNNSRLCGTCRTKLTAELEVRWDRAFFAALTGLCANTQIIDTDKVVIEAEKTADLTIRRGTASRDAAIAEVVG